MEHLHQVCEKYSGWYDLENSPLKLFKRKNPKDFDKEAVLKQLKELCEIKCEYEEVILLWWAHEENPLEQYHGIYLAAPVMMALLLREYVIAEKLIDQGYDANDFLLEEQAYVEIPHNKYARHVPLYISQLIMSRTDIPASLFRKVCDSQICANFCFISDYWKNPFLMTEEVLEGNKCPSVHGFQEIANYDRRLLQGMLDSITDLEMNTLEAQEVKEAQILLQKLIQCFWGMADDIVSINQCLTRYIYKVYDRLDMEEMVKGYSFWIKLLPILIQACGEDIGAQKQIITSVFFEYHEIERIFMLKDTQRNRLLRKLKYFLYSYCPKWYSAEVFMEEIWENKHWPSYSDMLDVWMEYSEEIIPVDKRESLFPELILKILGKYDHGFQYEVDSEAVIETRISEAIKCLELTECRDCSDNKTEGADMTGVRVTAELFSAILKLKNEELLLTCIQRGLITEKEIPALIKAAFVFHGEKLLPVLLLHKQAKE